MTDAAGQASAGRTIYAPRPFPIDEVQRQWSSLRELPEIACTDAWSAACAGWWRDERDRRLRRRTLDVLVLGDGELATWLTRDLDRRKLEDAHRHVTSQRAGLERDVAGRKLVKSALRTTPVLADHRGGARTIFVDARELPEHVALLSENAKRLDPQPILRASWFLQAIGAVHPFLDANGGTSRFLASLELVRGSLPPLVLSGAQRNRNYIEALMIANERNLEPLALVVHEATQQTLASILLADESSPAQWDAWSTEHADSWLAIANARWRELAGAPLADTMQRDEDLRAVMRVARRGVRVPFAPAPRCGTWRTGGDGEVILDLVIAPVRGGPVQWLVASVAACVGDLGSLGAVSLGEPISAIFVAPSTEPGDVLAARFRRWLDHRLDQCIRGIALWM